MATTRKKKVEEVVETVEETKEEFTEKASVKSKTTKKAEPKLVHEQKLQLKVQERKVLPVYPGSNLVVITNDRGGDLYVADKNVEFSKDFLVRPGESKEFEGVTNLVVGSYSRPLFTMQHFVK